MMMNIRQEKPGLLQIIVLLFFFLWGHVAFCQEDIYESLLREEVEVENPVYMPVIGIGTGVVNYLGEMQSDLNSLHVGNSASKINISTYLDKHHYVKGNFFILFLASMTGEKYFYDNPEPYFYNFKSDFISFGVNVQYSFEPFISTEALVKPFVSLGLEVMQFNTVVDFRNHDGDPYDLWDDGTYRNSDGRIVSRNYEYETDARAGLDYGLGNYAKTTVAFPLGLGFEMRVTERSFIQLGSGLHFTMSDLIDHVSAKNTDGLIGTKGNDRYVYSYASFHYDLFSDPQTVTVQRLFADIEFDYTMYGDEDGDWVFDRVDECPGTPEGVDVDSTGCPIDSDNDGVPDYIDLEPETKTGSFVDTYGRTLTVDQIIAMLESDAASREEVDRILRANLSRKHQARLSNIVIPDQFKRLDENEDGYISYEEFMKELDRFFDFESDYSVKDIEALREFFFSQ